MAHKDDKCIVSPTFVRGYNYKDSSPSKLYFNIFIKTGGLGGVVNWSGLNPARKKKSCLSVVVVNWDLPTRRNAQNFSPPVGWPGRC